MDGRSRQESLVASAPRIFLSYAKEDTDQVRAIYQKLRRQKITPWLDLEDLLPGDEWEARILEAIRQARMVLVFLSANSVNKQGYVQKEIREALDVAEKMPEGEVFIVPVRLGDAPVPTRLARWHWIDLFEKNGFSRLVRAIKASLGEELQVREKKSPESVNAQGQILDDMYFGFIQAAGEGLWYGVAPDGRFALSNKHTIDFFVNKPEGFESLLKEIKSAEELPVSRLAAMISSWKIVKADSQLGGMKKYSEILHLLYPSKGSYFAAVQTKYLTYALLRHPGASVYINGTTEPVVWKEGGKVLCVVMPYRLDKISASGAPS
jgi:hypothetical protein